MVAQLLTGTKKLKNLQLADCKLAMIGAESLGSGLSKNTTLKHLDISGNLFPPDSFKTWPAKCSKGLRCLSTLDVSRNSWLGPNDVHNLLLCFKNQVNLLKEDTRSGH